ncbi:MAG TPA: CAP domain-containing protein [Candidatus Solibacter sp.]|nr:CAP domain-containing protein [Candidatus Solibacter sp.]
MQAHRFCRPAAVALLFFLIVSTAKSQDRPVVPAPALHPSSDEQILLDSVNREREAAGLQPLKWDDALAAAALRHAERMVREPDLSHQYPGEPPLSERAAQAGARFSSVAENIALGPAAADIHYGWMHSPGHRRNILNPELTAVGIATIRGSAGLFAVQDFARQVEDLSLRQQEEQVISLLLKNGLRRATATQDARKTCAMASGYAGSRVSYIVHFEVMDLSKLPDQLASKVHTRAYQEAAVGACPSTDPGGFTRYRIAVLLN